MCYILKHLKDKKLLSVHIYYMVMTSFSFSNCTEELSFASFFYTQFENSNDVIPCNKYEQITPSYRLSVNHNIPRACLLNRLQVPAMDLKSNRQACDVTY